MFVMKFLTIRWMQLAAEVSRSDDLSKRDGKDWKDRNSWAHDNVAHRHIRFTESEFHNHG